MMSSAKNIVQKKIDFVSKILGKLGKESEKLFKKRKLFDPPWLASTFLTSCSTTKRNNFEMDSMKISSIIQFALLLPSFTLLFTIKPLNHNEGQFLCTFTFIIVPFIIEKGIWASQQSRISRLHEFFIRFEEINFPLRMDV